MDFIKGFIETLGLDSSFFIQLVWAVGLYFILAKILLKPYFRLMEKRENLTGGRFKSSRKLEEDIEQLKIQYEEKAKKVHAEFQKDFGEIKKQVEWDHKARLSELQRAWEAHLQQEQKRILKEKKEQTDLLKRETPHFVESLVEKLR